MRSFLVHTGQHYDLNLSRTFFEQLKIPEADVNLDVGSGSHAVQTAEIMKRFEPVLDSMAVDAVLVVGDVNSTIACALVAAKKCVPVVHVEAGLRSGDRTMPEEINRIVTDSISDILFVTEHSAIDNLLREGIKRERVHFSGNVMIDSLLESVPRAPLPSAVVEAAGYAPAFIVSGYAVLTLHRPSNVDDPAQLAALLRTLAEACAGLPIVFPAHPRTQARIESAALGALTRWPPFLLMPPVGYLEMVGLIAKAKVVITDSGGLQEETTALGVPCMTLRDNTERPVTVEQGTNTLVGSDPHKLSVHLTEFMATGGKRGRIPELWDGRAADRIAAGLKNYLKMER